MYSIRFNNGKTLTPSKIVCVGRNYAKHIEEMKSSRTKDPVLFLKPNSALCDAGKPLQIPTQHGAVHHEIELAICIGKGGQNISRERVPEHIAGFGLALDLTLRDMQSVAKEKGLPWAVTKGFDGACPVSEFVPAEQVTNAQELDLELKLNGTLRQKGNTRQMIFTIPALISYISRFFTLEEGDLILTGTPAGVGPLTSGDRIEAAIEGVAKTETVVA